jgi:hypothetical protein
MLKRGFFVFSIIEGCHKLDLMSRGFANEISDSMAFKVPPSGLYFKEPWENLLG